MSIGIMSLLIMPRRRRRWSRSGWRRGRRAVEIAGLGIRQQYPAHRRLTLEIIVVTSSDLFLPAVIIDLLRSRFTVSITNIHQGRVTMKRRDFIKDSAAVAAASTLGFNIKTYDGSPNGVVRVAVVGAHGQGKAHIGAYSKMADVEIAAICDVDDTVLKQRCGEIEKSKGKRPKEYVDIRKLLEDKTIDAISIATPNHWHSLMGVWACQAGKDVYVEKPCSHSYWEGRQLVNAARKYNRIVQHGTNSRSTAALREAVQKLREGVIGDVYMARGLCFKWRESIGKKQDGPVPQGVDYDLWLGAAPARPVNTHPLQYNTAHE